MDRVKGQGARVKAIILAALLVAMPLFSSGCAPTYPKEKFKESIVRVCKDEYKLDVKVETMGKTIAIYLPLENLIDFTFSITKSAGEKINDVILTVSRVALSTDANYDFYVVIAHDVRIPEIQIVIIKTVDDVKRFLLNDISRSEYAKRMIVDIRFSPQAQKERAIKDVFEKMKIEDKLQEDVMTDFFRSAPTAMGDIGYWNDRFYIKDITYPEFFAEQMGSRIRMEFREEKKLFEIFLIKTSKCGYVQREGKKFFVLDVAVENRTYGVPDPKTASMMTLETVLKVVSEVTHNYKFDDYDFVDISYQKDREPLRVTRDDIENFRKKKISASYFISGN